MVDLTPDELLTTTRAVRRRLDPERPVAQELIEECLTIALQAPTGGNRQRWSFVVVTDPERRAALAELYRQGFDHYRTDGIDGRGRRGSTPTPEQARVLRSALHLRDHMQEVPVLLVPCIRPRTDGRPIVEQASAFASVVPAVWSFMLAAPARGLGTVMTTVHLFHEREAAEILGIPFDRVMQVGIVPVAHTIGTDFAAGRRKPLDEVVHWNAWGTGTPV
jgi:nitroreductase